MKKLLVAFALSGLVFLAAGSPAQAAVMWGASSPGWDVGGPEVFKVDTSSGGIVSGSKWTYSQWNWIMGLADSGDYLYVTADKMSDQGNMLLMKLDRSTGAVISETDVAGLLGTTYSHINALEYRGGTLYGVENCTWDTTYRGHIVVMDLGPTGDVTTASVGAYVGPYPDGGLDYYEGKFYASHWKSGGDPGESWIGTLDAADVADASKSFSSTVYTTPAPGLIDGWQFDGGTLIGVSWQNIGLYDIDPATGDTTTLFSSISGVSSGHTMAGLDAVIPEPASVIVWGLLGAVAFAGAWGVRRRRA